MQQIGIRGLNHLVRSEAWAQDRLRQHAGATLLVEAGWLKVTLSIDQQGLFCQSEASATADVTLTIPRDAALAALLDRDKLFASVKLGGSADVAESLAFVFRHLKWDAEGDLAAIVGDIPARRLAMVGNALVSGIQESVAKASVNFTEYAAQDSGLLVSEADVASFSSEVYSLRDEVVRLEKRISML